MVVDTGLYIFVETHETVYHKEDILLCANKQQSCAKGLAMCLKCREDKNMGIANINQYFKKIIKPQTKLKRGVKPDHVMLKSWASCCRKRELITGCKPDKKPATGGLWEVALNAVNWRGYEREPIERRASSSLPHWDHVAISFAGQKTVRLSQYSIADTNQLIHLSSKSFFFILQLFLLKWN